MTQHYCADCDAQFESEMYEDHCCPDCYAKYKAKKKEESDKRFAIMKDALKTLVDYTKALEDDKND